MRDEQEALGDNFESFINEFVKKDIDFKMAITTTDTTGNNNGKEWKDSMAKLTSDKLKEDESKFIRNFRELVQVGTRGSGRERGILASESFANRYGNQWLRDDAYFTIIYLSDERDQSPKAVENHLKQIKKWKENDGYIKANSIVNMRYTSWYKRYKEIADTTGGEVASIRDDFHETLLNMGGKIASLADQFPLSNKPQNLESITVHVDGIENSDWVYNAEQNSIQFQEDLLPPAESKIEISYEIEK